MIHPYVWMSSAAASSAIASSLALLSDCTWANWHSSSSTRSYSCSFYAKTSSKASWRILTWLISSKGGCLSDSTFAVSLLFSLDFRSSRTFKCSSSRVRVMVLWRFGADAVRFCSISSSIVYLCKSGCRRPPEYSSCRPSLSGLFSHWTFEVLREDCFKPESTLDMFKRSPKEATVPTVVLSPTLVETCSLVLSSLVEVLLLTIVLGGLCCP